MAVLFAGSEREALVQGGSTGYSESTSYRRTAYSRASSLLSGGDYLAPFQTSTSEVWLNWRTAADQFGESNIVRCELRDASNNVVARVSFSAQVPTAQYWDGSTYQNVPGTSPAELNTTLTQYTLHVKQGTGADGEVELFVNGTLTASATGLDLTAYGDMTNARLLYTGSRSRGYVEVVASDTESTVDWGVLTVVPSADGTDTDGTGAVSTVNELDMNTATYIEFDTAGQKRSFVHSTINVENFVRGVTVSACARRVDGTGPQQMRPYVIVGGTRYFGTTFSLTTSFTNYTYTWSESPATSTDWTTAEVNNASFEMGWEMVA